MSLFTKKTLYWEPTEEFPYFSKFSTLATWCGELTHLKRPWCWERLRAGEGDDRGWDFWMASLTQWTWVWVNSGRWWWTGRPGMLRFMGSQRVRHDWVTELNWTEPLFNLGFVFYIWGGCRNTIAMILCKVMTHYFTHQESRVSVGSWLMKLTLVTWWGCCLPDFSTLTIQWLFY